MRDIGDGNALFVWQVQEHDGCWSMITGRIPGSRVEIPLIGRTRQVVEAFQALAEVHASRTNQPLRLAQFALVKALK